LVLPSAHAQTASCGLASIQEATQLTYPPIAKAAHVEGLVILLATFVEDGTVSKIRIIQSPPLLNQLMGHVAEEFVKSWKANSYTGPRECPIVINFMLGGETDHPKTSVIRSDIQHIRITAETYPPTVNYAQVTQ
jgi:hypothetical protein